MRASGFLLSVYIYIIIYMGLSVSLFSLFSIFRFLYLFPLFLPSPSVFLVCLSPVRVRARNHTDERREVTAIISTEVLVQGTG